MPSKKNVSCSWRASALPGVCGCRLAGRLLDQGAKLVDIQRLDQIIERPLPDGLLAVLDRRVGRDQDHFRRIPSLTGLAQHVQTIDLPFQLQVGHDHIDRLVPQHLDRVLARVDRQGLDRQLAEGLDNPVGVIPLVVHHQDDRLVFCPMTAQTTTCILKSGSARRRKRSIRKRRTYG
jgi:hypothetical protein